MTQSNPELSELYNLHIAPGFADFKSAAIADLAGEFAQAGHWVANYFGNSVLRASFAEPQRQLVLAYLRRTQHAFAAYHAARAETLDHLQSPSVNKYYSAISDWETFALDFSMACDIFYRGFNTGVFKRGDGSRDERLYSIANNIKHPSSYLTNSEEGAAAVPLWLTSAGLHSYGGLAVTFQDAAAILTEISTIADDLQDPARHPK